MYSNGLSLYSIVDLSAVMIIVNAEEKNKYVTCVTTQVIIGGGCLIKISHPTSQKLLIGPKYEIKTKKGPVAPF